MFETNILYEKSKSCVILPRISPHSYQLKRTPILLYGPPKSGKTFIALEYAKKIGAKKPLFIDCADMRFPLAQIQQELLAQTLDFDLLVVDNYTHKLTLPNVNNIILISPTPLCAGISHILDNLGHLPQTKESKNLDSLYQMAILPLSFMEFVSFSKAQKIESIFSNFLKNGNLPEMAFLAESKAEQKIESKLRHQEIISLAFSKHTQIFIEIVNFQGREFSTLKLFRNLKNHIKTSKDTIYAFVEYLKNQQSIFLLPHSLQKDSNKSSSKLYLYNFALPYMLSSKPHFQHIFENMVFCELLTKHNKTTNNSSNTTLSHALSYNDECDFFINDIAYFAMPFPNASLLNARLNKLTKHYKKVVFISIDVSEKHAQYEIVRFIDFALNDTFNDALK